MKTNSIRYSVYPYNVEIHVLGIFFFSTFDIVSLIVSFFFFVFYFFLELLLVSCWICWINYPIFICLSFLLSVFLPPWFQCLIVAFSWLSEAIHLFLLLSSLPLLLLVALFSFVCLGPLWQRLSSDACRSWIPCTWMRPKSFFIRWSILSQWRPPGVRVYSSCLLSAPHVTSKSRKLFELSIRKI